MKAKRWMVSGSATLLPACGPLTAIGACSRRPHAPATAARIELRGGPNPGTYEAGSPEAGCSRDLLGPGSSTVQMSDWTDPKNGLRSLSW